MGFNMDAAFKVTAGVTGQQAIDKLAHSVETINEKFTRVAEGGKKLAQAFAVKEFGEFIKHTIDLGDELNDLSQKTGVSVTMLGKFMIGANTAGVGLEQLAGALSKFNVNTVEAYNNSAKLAGAFRALNVDIKDVNGQLVPTDQLLLRVADRFATMPDGAGKAAIAARLFGKALGDQMIPFLNMGSEEIKKFGLNLSEDFAQKADQFNDSLVILGARGREIGIQIASQLLPPFLDVSNAMADFIKTQPDAIGFFDAVGESVRLTAAGVIVLDNSIRSTYDAITTVSAQMRARISGDRAEIEKLEREFQERNKARDTDQRSILQKLGKNSIVGGISQGKSIEQIRQEQQDAYKVNKPKRTQGANLSDLDTDAANRLKQEIDQLEKYIEKEKQQNITLAQQSDYIGLTTVEVEKLKAARQLDSEVAEKTLKMSPAVKQRFIEESNAIKQQRLELIELNYEQSRTWDTGTKEALTQYVENIGDAASRARDFWEKSFKGMEDSIVNFAKTGKLSISGLADSIIEDLIRIEVQQSITGPLAGLLGSFNPFSAAGSAGGSVYTPGSIVATDLAPFAMGGIMSSRGSVPLRKYAAGGIAKSPQMAVFGEGSMNEAYVPLPDGRRIPVVQQGARGAPVVNIEINMSGQDQVSGSSDGRDIGIQIAAAVKAVLIREKRQGGLLTR